MGDRSRFSTWKRVFVTTVSGGAIALVAAIPAHAQDVKDPPQQPGAEGADPNDPARAGTGSEGATQTEPTSLEGEMISPDESETILVTGSRVARTGADQPTPVTVLSSAELTAGAPTLVEGLAQVPQLATSSSPQNPQNFGPVSFLDLRGLGPNRTLILLDGRRLTPATTGTAPNINSLPHNLVQRVDIVTGGASAAYGSDAVAGVVNFVLDTKFEGIKGLVQSNITERGDDQNYTLALTGGTSFAGGRGHIIVAGEYFDRAGVYNRGDRAWSNEHWLPLPNPTVTPSNPGSPTNPNVLIVNNAGFSRSPGGVVLTGPLAGTEFGRGGSVLTHDFGSLRSGQYQVGGNFTNTNFDSSLTHEEWRWSAFSHATFDLTDNLTVFGEVNLSKNMSYNHIFPPSYDLPIFSGNAYLPAAVQARMTALGLASITVSKITLDWQLDPNDRHYQGGFSVITDEATSKDYSGGLSGKFGVGEKDFTWNAYYQHGTTSYERHVPNDPVNINIFNAMDAVRVTAANQGASGLAIGSIVCRTSLSNPANGCVPMNVLGPNLYTQAAMDYIYADAWLRQETTQDAAAVNLQGQIFDIWGGPVGAAVGVEWRKVRTVGTSDPLSQTRPRDYVLRPENAGVRGLPAIYLTPNPGVFLFGNYQPIEGEYNVKEIYGELVVPLLRDTSFAKALELNGAVRYADYSTSGGALTWKAGLVWEPTRDLRFRATRSRDIRAPNIIELFSAARQLPVNIRDDNLNGEVYQVPSFQLGNPDLAPERADTTAFGIVYSPSFVPGFTFILDLYDIKIQDAISTVAAQDILDDCRRGNTLFCTFIDRDATNRIVQIRLPNSNVAEFRARGADLELNYNRELGSGRFSLRALVSYVRELSSASAISEAPPIDRAGQLGGGGVPDWSGQLQANFTQDGFTFLVRERFVGAGKLNTTYNTDKYNVPGAPTFYINDNTVSSVFYTDITLRKKFDVSGGEIEMFGTVTNLFDQDPPVAPALNITMEPTNNALYDVLGRRFTVGARFEF
jgi:iron complex outermembrane receptor protein